MKEVNWSDADVQRVLDMKASGMTTDAIAEVLGKTPKSIYQMIYRRKRGFVKKRAIFKWEAKDMAELGRLLDLGLTSRDIAEKMGRTHAAVATKISGMRAKEKAALPPPIIEWRPIPQHTSTTAMLMGDPLPGRSALDRRRANHDAPRNLLAGQSNELLRAPSVLAEA